MVGVMPVNHCHSGWFMAALTPEAASDDATGSLGGMNGVKLLALT